MGTRIGCFGARTGALGGSQWYGFGLGVTGRQRGGKREETRRKHRRERGRTEGLGPPLPFFFLSYLHTSYILIYVVRAFYAY
jgi:hypothetical protein